MVFHFTVPSSTPSSKVSILAVKFTSTMAEASLVRALEELGIGRPSTYAPTITTILARRYITKEK